MKLSSISAVATAIIVMMMVTPTIAADGATTVDLSPLYSTGVEFVAALVSGVLIALLGWIAALIKRKIGVDIDAAHRETLHSALMTGVTAGLTKLGTKLPGTVDVKSALVAEGVTWAEQAAADAIAHFGLTPEQVETLAASKVAQVLGTSAATSTSS